MKGLKRKGSEVQVEISCDEEAQRRIVCEPLSEVVSGKIATQDRMDALQVVPAKERHTGG